MLYLRSSIDFDKAVEVYDEWFTPFARLRNRLRERGIAFHPRRGDIGFEDARRIPSTDGPPLVIYDRTDNRVRQVLDTKYKLPTSTPATDDIAQVLAYAQAKGATEAVLVYPAQLRQPLDVRIGEVRVRSATFALDGDLAHAGTQFLQALGL